MPVVAIASYTNHLLKECDAKSNFTKCPRCSEAIHKHELKGHVAEKACDEPCVRRRQLENPPDGDDGCRRSPRHLIAINKQVLTGRG
ncbi:hypothetical protein DPMN_140719 [Dreissena polymorpha]|uniref:Centrosomal protein CEP104 Zn finger domain-containing protein n=1 Tax=Dreissena polymorpha TaxID=45954 RepID=A0A9D4GBD4_DREPO|nr:hypothetical protein DPMN_140719 [Dreissena polymorpha]